MAEDCGRRRGDSSPTDLGHARSSTIIAPLGLVVEDGAAQRVFLATPATEHSE